MATKTMDIHDKAQALIDYAKANGKSNDETSLALNALYAQNDKQNGNPVAPVQPKTGVGKVISAIGKGADAVISGVGKAAQKTVGFAEGKDEFMPATDNDVGANGGPQDVVKILANTFSDAPAVLNGIKNLIAHPIDSTKGIIDYYGGVASDGFNAIRQSIKEGNPQAIEEAISKAEKSVINHPLQAIMAFEGAKGAVEGVADTAGDIKDKGIRQTAADKGTELVEKGKQIAQKIGDAYNSAKNVLSGNGENLGFKSKSAIHQMTVRAANNLDSVLSAQKKLSDLTEKVNSFKQKVDEESAQNKKALSEKGSQIKDTDTKLSQNAIEYQKAQAEAKVAQNELDDMLQKQKDIANQAGTAQQSEFAKNGFSSIPDLAQGVTDFFKTAKAKLSEVYDNSLGNAKIDLKGVFDGINKFQDYLRGISDTKTLKAIQPMIDNLKIRDIVSEAGEDNMKLTQLLSRSDVDPRLWRELDFDKIRKEYPQLTSDNIKGTRNNIEATIRDNNTDALKNFGTNVKNAFKETFKNAIRDTYGQDQLDKVDETDKNWSELMKNPLSTKDNPTLADIQKNWKSFTENARQIPEGKGIIQKIQNYTGEQILNAAERNGEYSAQKIASGIKKYGDIIGGTVRDGLNGVRSLLEQKTPEQSVQEAKVNEAKQNQSDVKEQQTTLKNQKASQKLEMKDLQDQQSKIDADAKVVGADSADIIKNIKGIDTMDGLNSFLEKSGKSIEELRPVILQSIIESVDKEAGKDANAPFDVDRINEYIKGVNKLGGDGPEGQKVNDEMLGEEGRKAFNDVKAKVDEYNKLKTTKGRNLAQRAVQASFGAMLMTIGFGRFFGARQILSSLSAGKAGKFESLSSPEGRIRPESDESSSPGIIGLAKNVISKIAPLGSTGGNNRNKE